MATGRRHAQAPDGVQRTLVGIDRIIALVILGFVSLSAPHGWSGTAIAVTGGLTAVFVVIIFYADFRYQSGRK